MHTESPACIDSLDTQKAMLDAETVTFTGTEDMHFVKATQREGEGRNPETEIKRKEVRDTMIQYQNVFDAFMRCDTDIAGRRNLLPCMTNLRRTLIRDSKRYRR